MIRYHSFYAAHREGAYQHLMNDRDRGHVRLGAQVQPLRPLLQGRTIAPDLRSLEPYYRDLIAEYFPAEVSW